MAPSEDKPFASRAGEKLAHALLQFDVHPRGWVCADLGASTGGFSDCLLRHGATKVYSVERGYGVLDARLRNDPRVVVMERTDALHVTLPEPVRLATIDAGWTRQRMILPVARRLLTPDGCIVTLVKPHYEAPPSALRDGVLPPNAIPAVLETLRAELAGLGLAIRGETRSPILGRGGNQEWLWWLMP